MYITFLAGLMVGATVGLVVFSLLKAASKETPVRYGRSLPESYGWIPKEGHISKPDSIHGRSLSETYHAQPPKEVPRPVDADSTY